MRYCDDLWLCYVKTIDWTFKNTGAVGAKIESLDNRDYYVPDPSDGEVYLGIKITAYADYFGRWIFDNLFNIFVVMIVVNMVGGEIKLYFIGKFINIKSFKNLIFIFF